MMLSRLQKIMATLAVLALITLLSCASFQNLITPCYINEETAIYAKEELTSFMPFTTLSDAERINNKMNHIHQLNQIELNRLAEDDILVYGFLKDILFLGIQDAQEFQASIFSPSGPLGLLLPALSGLGIGAILIKRPQEKELEKKLNGQR